MVQTDGAQAHRKQTAPSRSPKLVATEPRQPDSELMSLATRQYRMSWKERHKSKPSEVQHLETESKTREGAAEGGEQNQKTILSAKGGEGFK